MRGRGRCDGRTSDSPPSGALRMVATIVRVNDALYGATVEACNSFAASCICGMEAESNGVATPCATSTFRSAICCLRASISQKDMVGYDDVCCRCSNLGCQWS